jgi:hypothetical protein
MSSRGRISGALLVNLRKQAVMDLIREGFDVTEESADFGCDRCIGCETCEFAYDKYNVGGNCVSGDLGDGDMRD